jgi:hypothetical protein
VLNLEEIIDRESAARGAELDCRVHRRDVAEDLGRDAIGRAAALGEHDLGLEQAARSDLEPFDLGRGDGFRPQEKACEAFEAHMGRARCVQPSNRCVGVGEVGDEISG